MVPALDRVGLRVARNAPRERSAHRQKLCFGDTPTLADICLVPQVFNANRFSIDTTRYPTIQRIADYASTLDAFKAAEPGVQPDAE